MAFAVFLSHAGSQKRDFVDQIFGWFNDGPINVFMDQHSLPYGCKAEEVMEKAVHEVCVGEYPFDDPAPLVYGVISRAPVMNVVKQVLLC
jgi:hypothetical protein